MAGAISNLLICLNYGVFQSSCLLAASVKSIGYGCFFLFFLFFSCVRIIFSLSLFFRPWGLTPCWHVNATCHNSQCHPHGAECVECVIADYTVSE